MGTQRQVRPYIIAINTVHITKYVDGTYARVNIYFVLLTDSRATVRLWQLKDICTRTLTNTERDEVSPSLQIMRQSIKALQELVPRNFSHNFRNPCWYSTLDIPSNLSNYFNSLKTIRYPIFNTTVATRIVKKVRTSLFNRHHQQKLFCIPYVYLAGFPKCGTTMLYWLMAQNPMVAKPIRKEGHFWATFRENGAYVDKQLHSLWYLHQFMPAADHISHSPLSITIDGSPSTLWKTLDEPEDVSELCIFPSTIADLVPNARFIVIMRDPVKRLFSDFWFFCSHHKWGKKHKVVVPEHYTEDAQQIFHNLTVEAISQFHTCVDAGVSSLVCVHRATQGYTSATEDCFPMRLGIGLYYYHLLSWLATIPRRRFLFLRTEDLAADPYSVMQRVWHFLDIPAQTKEEIQSTLARKSHWNSNEWLRSAAYKDRFAMLPQTEHMLRDFYRPHNQLLAQLLFDEKYLWEDIIS